MAFTNTTLEAANKTIQIDNATMTSANTTTRNNTAATVSANATIEVANATRSRGHNKEGKRALKRNTSKHNPWQAYFDNKTMCLVQVRYSYDCIYRLDK